MAAQQRSLVFHRGRLALEGLAAGVGGLLVFLGLAAMMGVLVFPIGMMVFMFFGNALLLAHVPTLVILVPICGVPFGLGVAWYAWFKTREQWNVGILVGVSIAGLLFSILALFFLGFVAGLVFEVLGQ